MAEVGLLVLSAAVVVISAAGSVFWLKALQRADRRRRAGYQARLRRELLHGASTDEIRRRIDAAATMDELDEIQRTYGTPD